MFSFGTERAGLKSFFAVPLNRSVRQAGYTGLRERIAEKRRKCSIAREAVVRWGAAEEFTLGPTVPIANFASSRT